MTHLRISRISRRRFLALGAACIGTVALGARVAYVNATALPPAEQIWHAQGEWVELNGAFCSSVDEYTEGYAVRLNAARLVSYNEFIGYANDGSRPIEGLDVPSIVDLDVTLRNDQNEGDEKGSLYIFGMNLVPARLNDYLIISSNLLSMTQKAMRVSGNPGRCISIKPQTTYDLHLPYVVNDSSTAELNGETVEARFLQPLTDVRYEWHLSRLPVQHIVEVEVG